MTGESHWREQPTVGSFVAVPLALPPTLLAAIGYDGATRYVALRWSGGAGGDVLWTDGSTTAAGWWRPWRLLVREHLLGRVMFDRYDFGDLNDDPGARATHWLLVDTWENTMHVGLAPDVEQLLRTQPSTLAAVAAEIGPERIRELAEQWMSTAAPASREITAAIVRRGELEQQLKGWLDARLTELDDAPT